MNLRSMIDQILNNKKMNINYTNENEITNFRGICYGNIKYGVLYRGSHPFMKDKERDEIYSKLVSEAGINCVINMAGNSDDLEYIANMVSWYNTLLKKGNVTGLDIQFNFDFFDQFETDVFNYRLRQGFLFLITHNSPYLIHCNAGADRTGFISVVIELLFGANLNEVIYDYLLSYGKIIADAKDDGENYLAGRNIYGQINAVIKGKIEDSGNLQANIKKYFLEGIGLTPDELEMLICKLSG